jgi:hypothetical protein
MWYLDDWHDYVRVVLILISLWSAITLLLRWRKFAEVQDWTTKTRDYWYSLFMWTLVGIVVPIQGIYLDRPLTPGFAVVVAAVLVTGKGLKQRGAWGGSDD